VATSQAALMRLLAPFPLPDSLTVMFTLWCLPI